MRKQTTATREPAPGGRQRVRRAAMWWVQDGRCEITGNPIFTTVPHGKVKEARRLGHTLFTSEQALALSVGKSLEGD
jgi:hypothetical protein